MKLPRIKSAPCCYTLREWAYRTCINQTGLFLFVAILFFYLSTTLNADQQGARAIFITMGVIFCVPVLSGIILFIGLLKDNQKLLQIWVIFSIVGAIILTLLFVALAIFSFVNGEAVNGIYVLVVTVVIIGSMIYNTLIVHSVRLEIIEKETTQNTEAAVE